MEKDTACSVLEYRLNDDYPLYFWGDNLNNRHDFYVESNCEKNEIETLIFLDSRGISRQYQGSLIEKIKSIIENKVKYLIVARPLEITTWMTLYNFWKLNEIKAKKLITNMGFVDFTPKKESIIKSSVEQGGYYFPGIVIAEAKTVEKYVSKSGEILDLFIQEYSTLFVDALVRLFEDVHILLINTPELRHDFTCPRERPPSFFIGINNANTFNKALPIKGRIIETTDFTVDDCYDGVHYTERGNNLIFEKLCHYL